MDIDELLAPHQSIGWDVDGTILDHPNAPRMHRYILDHPEKRHFIVTFRSHGWQHNVFDELAARHEEYAGPEHFDGILNVPDLTFARFQNLVRDARMRGQTFVDSDHPDAAAYVTWKGKVCKEHGITALVDDNPDHVAPGCDLYGVLHVHPDDF